MRLMTTKVHARQHNNRIATLLLGARFVLLKPLDPADARHA